MEPGACGAERLLVKCILNRSMDWLTFSPGQALLRSDSPVAPWSAVFEDEGPAGYFYGFDRREGSHNESVLDAMLIYNTGSLAGSGEGRGAERVAAIEWSPSGLQAVLYLDGRPQALLDFEARRGYCRLDFPNFLAGQGESWRRESHAWSDEAFARFEAAKFDAALNS